MNDDGYSGWKNWETWQIMLWLDNEEGSYNAYRAFARATSYSVTPSGAESFVKELMPEGTPDFDDASDYDVVDWDEIADAFNDDGEENPDDDDDDYDDANE